MFELHYYDLMSVLNRSKDCTFSCEDSPEMWSPLTSYDIGSIVIPPDPLYNGYQYKLMESNSSLYNVQRKPLSGTISPNWNSDIVNDGELVWKKDGLTPMCEQLFGILGVNDISDVPTAVQNLIDKTDSINSYLESSINTLISKRENLLSSVNSLDLPTMEIPNYLDFGITPELPDLSFLSGLSLPDFSGDTPIDPSELTNMLECISDEDSVGIIEDLVKDSTSKLDVVNSLSPSNIVKGIYSILDDEITKMANSFNLEFTNTNLGCNQEDGTGNTDYCRTEYGRRCICMKLSSILSYDTKSALKSMKRDYDMFKAV